MEELAEIVRNHPNLTVIADEVTLTHTHTLPSQWTPVHADCVRLFCAQVYEKIVYGMKHVHFATIPGMEDRTITISSMGKTFSCTGWKVVVNTHSFVCCCRASSVSWL
jgi:hypothetical protein